MYGRAFKGVCKVLQSQWQSPFRNIPPATVGHSMHRMLQQPGLHASAHTCSTATLAQTHTDASSRLTLFQHANLAAMQPAVKYAMGMHWTCSKVGEAQRTVALRRSAPSPAILYIASAQLQAPILARSPHSSAALTARLRRSRLGALGFDTHPEAIGIGSEQRHGVCSSQVRPGLKLRLLMPLEVMLRCSCCKVASCWPRYKQFCKWMQALPHPPTLFKLASPTTQLPPLSAALAPVTCCSQTSYATGTGQG